jgi:hypothetical protein
MGRPCYRTGWTDGVGVCRAPRARQRTHPCPTIAYRQHFLNGICTERGWFAVKFSGSGLGDTVYPADEARPIDDDFSTAETRYP